MTGEIKVPTRSVPYLGPNNWPTWSCRMESALYLNDLWDVVIEDPPSAPTSTAASTSDDPPAPPAAALAAYTQALDEYTKRSKKAKALISLYVSDTHAHVMRSANTAKEAWAALAAYHAPKGAQRELALRQELLNLKQGTSETITQYFDRVSALQDRLREAAGETVDEKTVTASVLAGLNRSFNTAVDVIYASAQTAPTMESIKSSLLNIEQREQRQRRSDRGTHSNDTALLANNFCPAPPANRMGWQAGPRRPDPRRTGCRPDGSRPINTNSGRPRPQGPPPGLCLYCNQPGHWAHDCAKKKRDMAARNTDNSGSGSAYGNIAFTAIESSPTPGSAYNALALAPLAPAQPAGTSPLPRRRASPPYRPPGVYPASGLPTAPAPTRPAGSPRLSRPVPLPYRPPIGPVRPVRAGLAYPATSATGATPAATAPPPTYGWILDTGASRHITPHLDALRDLRPAPEGISIKFGNGAEAAPTAEGDAWLELPNGTTATITNVLHMPDAAEPLFSVNLAAQNGFDFSFGATDCAITYGDTYLTSAPATEHRIYRLYGRVIPDPSAPATGSAYAARSTESPNLWHQRFGHLGYSNLTKLASKTWSPASTPALRSSRLPPTHPAAPAPWASSHACPSLPPRQSSLHPWRSCTPTSWALCPPPAQANAGTCASWMTTPASPCLQPCGASLMPPTRSLRPSPCCSASQATWSSVCAPTTAASLSTLSCLISTSPRASSKKRLCPTRRSRTARPSASTARCWTRRAPCCAPPEACPTPCGPTPSPLPTMCATAPPSAARPPPPKSSSTASSPMSPTSAPGAPAPTRTSPPRSAPSWTLSAPPAA